MSAIAITGASAAGRRATLALAIAVLAACGAVAPAPLPPANANAAGSTAGQWGSQYAQLAAGGGTVVHLDPARSSVRIFVYRGGRAPRLGHNHVLTAPDFTGYAYVPPEGPGAARFDLEFRLDALQLDDPQLRQQLGPAFAAELTPGDIANTRAHMLGDDNLQAARFPFVRIHGLAVTGEGTHLAAQVAIELHGRQQVMWVPLEFTGSGAALTVAGSVILRQSDFGVQPYAALGGLIAVQDAIVVDFRLAGG